MMRNDFKNCWFEFWIDLILVLGLWFQKKFKQLPIGNLNGKCVD